MTFTYLECHREQQKAAKRTDSFFVNYCLFLNENKIYMFLLFGIFQMKKNLIKTTATLIPLNWHCLFSSAFDGQPKLSRAKSTEVIAPSLYLSPSLSLTHTHAQTHFISFFFSSCMQNIFLMIFLDKWLYIYAWQTI